MVGQQEPPLVNPSRNRNSRDIVETPFRGRHNAMLTPEVRLHAIAGQSEITISDISTSCGQVPSSTGVRRGLHAQILHGPRRWSLLNIQDMLWR